MKPQERPLMRSLGEFFGHIVKGVRTDPSKPADNARRPPPVATTIAPEGRVVVRTTVEERAAETASGPVVLRRTVIDEVQLPHQPRG